METEEMIKNQLLRMYDREIEETFRAVSNERVWRIESQTPEEYGTHTANINRLLKYVEALKKLKNDILKEEANNA